MKPIAALLLAVLFVGTSFALGWMAHSLLGESGSYSASSALLECRDRLGDTELRAAAMQSALMRCQAGWTFANDVAGDWQ